MYGIRNLPEILSLTVENVLTETLSQKLTINFKDNDIGIIYGEAGSGKTTLIHAIMLGLFGSFWAEKTMITLMNLLIQFPKKTYSKRITM